MVIISCSKQVINGSIGFGCNLLLVHWLIILVEMEKHLGFWTEVTPRMRLREEGSSEISKELFRQGRWSIPINSKFSGIELNCCMLLDVPLFSLFYMQNTFWSTTKAECNTCVKSVKSNFADQSNSAKHKKVAHQKCQTNRRWQIRF